MVAAVRFALLGNIAKAMHGVHQVMVSANGQTLAVEKDVEQHLVADLVGIEGDLADLGMLGLAGTDRLVIGVFGRASCVP